jgi:undecaprenyl phosphate N,N'-diacetylbacillosamine 1-phosphate transferase
LQRLLKRLLDLAASIPALVLLLPLFLLIFVAIKVEDRGPVFFRQKRVGKDSEQFYILKFRTMVEDAEKKGAGIFVEKEDPRITGVGRFLRHTSLDELPQLINILKGEMSLIGPRPTLAYQVDNYDERQMQRLSVKPGVTGWAQVNGRSSLSWPERIELDLWYIDNWSLWLDFLILLKTFRVVLQKSNLYKPPGTILSHL